MSSVLLSHHSIVFSTWILDKHTMVLIKASAGLSCLCMCLCICVYVFVFVFVGGDPWTPEHIVEGYIAPVVQPLHLIAHVLKQQLVLVQVHLQSASEQTQEELHPGRRDHTLRREGAREVRGACGERGTDSRLQCTNLAKPHYHYTEMPMRVTMSGI